MHFWKGGECLKRRITALIFICILMMGFAVPVFAENTASYINNITTVTADGSCSVTLQVTVHVENTKENLTFPLPGNAKNITLNGSSAKTDKSGGVQNVDISGVCGGYIGDVTLQFSYTLKNVVTYADEVMTMELPILCGFEFPVTALEFVITMPGEVTSRPYFTGGYRQSTMESIMTTAVKGNLISGSINQALDDYETISMTLTVNEEMFPAVSTYQREGNPELIPMGIIAGLAIIYWIITLRGLPKMRSRRSTPPEGVNAGEMGCRLTFTGADLTMMVMHWAQMGYILIHQDDNGRVLLYKRMDMGNERSLFEVKTFKTLFGHKRVVDGTGYQYAKLRQKIKRQIPGERAMCTSTSGNMRLFRFAFCAVQMLCGICYAMNMTNLDVLQILLGCIFVILGAADAWLIQKGMYRLHLSYKKSLYGALIMSAVWLLCGLIAGVFWIGLVTVAVQMLAGFAAAYGGKRSAMGQQNAQNIISYRNYLKNMTKEEFQTMRKADPECFFTVMPYALALDVEGKFASYFGTKKKMPDCPYLVTNHRGKVSAETWARTMREVVTRLDTRFMQLEMERFSFIQIR